VSSADRVQESVLPFDSEGRRLWGIVSRPTRHGGASRAAVLIVTGGPQYRVGSHRMFVLLARRLAQAGYPTLRFDYTGMGDSEGELCTFADAGADLRNALAALRAACPDAPGVVVWGLCDAASAALMFLAREPELLGIVAANPWARSDATLAAARVKHYYLQRLLQPDFWRKLLGGGVRWRQSIGSFWRDLRGARTATRPEADARALPFQERMAQGLRDMQGPLLLVMSGNDLTAREFEEYAGSSHAWRGLLSTDRVRRVDLVEADHTFSQRRWLSQVEDATLDWLAELRPRARSPRATPIT